MKNNILNICLAVCLPVTSIFAQNSKSLILNTNINVNDSKAKSYIAKNEISFMAPFEVSTLNPKSGSYDFYCNPFLTTPTSYKTLNTNGSSAQTAFSTSKTVGSINGKALVNSNGEAVYTIPIDMPIGTLKMHPKLNITYNSNYENGILGKGWNIDGLSSIYLVPTTLQYNTANTNFPNRNCGLSLDGNRLILVNGTYGENGSEYKTEHDEYKKITLNLNGNNVFTVQTKDGYTYEYGATTNSVISSGRIIPTFQSVISYKLSRVIDANGNFIRYTYGQENGESWIDKIEYTGNINGGIEPVNTIQFVYENRQDIRKVYTNEFNTVQTKILSEVYVLTKGKQYRKYGFSYAYDGMYSFLSEISMNGTGREQYNTTKITWGNKDLSSVMFNPLNLTLDKTSPSFDKAPPLQIITADFDGDGTNEMLKYTEGELTKVTYKGVPNLNTNWSLLKRNGVQNSFTEFASGTLFSKPANLNTFHLYARDIDNDGKSELINLYALKNSSSGNVIMKVYQLINNQLQDVTSAFPDFDRGFNYPEITSAYVDYTLQTGDFDGDGTLDPLIIQVVNVQNTISSKIIAIDGSGNPIMDPNFWGNWKTITVGNIDGDLKADVICINQYGAKTFELNDAKTTLVGLKSYQLDDKKNPYYSSFPMYMAAEDLNGDNLTDIFIIDNIYQAFAAFTKNTDTTSFMNFGVFDGSTSAFTFGELTGDNRADLVAVLDNEIQVYNFKTDGTILTLKLPYTVNGSTAPYGLVYTNWNSYLNLVDFNSDGKDDILIPNPTDYFIGTLHDEFYTGDLVNSIEDGYGNLTSFNYSRLNQIGAPYSKSTTSQLDMISKILPINVVKSKTEKYGNTLSVTENFQYLNYLYNKKYQYNAGFEQITFNNSATNNEIVTNYIYPSDLYYSQFNNKSSLKTNGNLVKETTKSYTVTNTNNVYTINSESSYSKNYVNNSSEKEITNYDQYGNINSKENTTFDDLSATTKVYTTLESNQFGMFGSWCPSSCILSTITKTNYSSGENSSIFLNSFDYDHKGNLIKKVENLNSANPITTVFSNFNFFGLALNSSVSANGITTKTGAVAYDPTGRFIIKMTDAAGLIKQYNYDEFGNKTYEVLVDGNEIRYQYDSFGNLINMTDVDGTTSSTSIWTQGSPAGSLYAKKVVKTGKPAKIDYFDAVGRNIKTTLSGKNSTFIYTDYVYNANGTVAKQSNAYFSGESPIWTEFTYDFIQRVTIEKTNALQTKYNYGTRTVSVTDAKGRTTSYKQNALGLLLETKDVLNNTITYSYNNLWQPKTSGTNTLSYDALGNKISLTDPNVGTTNYTYDALGRLICETSPAGSKTNFQYDILDRVVNMTGPDENTSFTYITSGNGTGKLSSISNNNNASSKNYTYDSKGNVISLKENSAGQLFETKFNYNNYSDINSITYPTGFTINREYDNFGYLTKITRADNQKVIWSQGAESTTIAEYILGNNQKVSYSYSSDYKQLTSISVDNNFKWSYNFEKETGNLINRKDVNRNLLEEFSYDQLDRLTNISQNGVLNNTLNYANNGNINSKSDAGSQYIYDNAKPNLLNKINNFVNAPVNGQFISYNSFKYPTVISENQNVYSITYGPDRMRVKTVLKNNGTEVATRYYAFNFEKEIKAGTSKEIHYIEANGKTVATFITTNTANGQMYYVLSDYLGSILQLRKDDGTVAEEMSYDAWGRRRNPATWSTSTVTLPSILNRGFTGHEHLDLFGLINMNARLYDPLVGRMLSADNDLQDPLNSQNYNRYSYCFNNPLKFIDPTGNNGIEWSSSGMPSGPSGQSGGPSGPGNSGNGSGSQNNGSAGGSNNSDGGDSKSAANLNGGGDDVRERNYVPLPSEFQNFDPAKASWEIENGTSRGLRPGATVNKSVEQVTNQAAQSVSTVSSTSNAVSSVSTVQNYGNSVQNGNQNGYSIDKSVNHLNSKANLNSQGACSRYVQNAIQKGGINTGNIYYPGGSYGPRLQNWGFAKISSVNYKPIKGDIIVIQGYEGGKTCNNGLPCGHIQMFNGNIWVSDFFQTKDIYPGPGYRSNSPSYEIYRWINP